MDEEWRPVVGYEGHYEVSDLGRVRALTREVRTCYGTVRVQHGRVLVPQNTRKGHLKVTLCPGDGTEQNRFVHVLVCEAFRGPRPPGQETRHLDGDPKNNALVNLKWGTRSENTKDSIRHGTFKGHRNLRPAEPSFLLDPVSALS